MKEIFRAKMDMLCENIRASTIKVPLAITNTFFASPFTTSPYKAGIMVNGWILHPAEDLSDGVLSEQSCPAGYIDCWSETDLV